MEEERGVDRERERESRREVRETRCPRSVSPPEGHCGERERERGREREEEREKERGRERGIERERGREGGRERE